MEDFIPFEDAEKIASKNSHGARLISPVRAASFAHLELKERQWCVPGYIPANQPALLSGDGGTGKSLVALQLCVAVASETKWLGMPVAKGVCLFLTAEDDEAEIHRRLADIIVSQEVRYSDLQDLIIVPLAGQEAVLARPKASSDELIFTDLFAELEELIAKLRPSLLVIDPLADVFGGNEIIRTQARQFIAALRNLCVNYEVTIILLSHPSLQGLNSGSGTSGSTAWSNSVRSRLYFEHQKSSENDTDPDVRVLTVKKSNYAKKDATLLVKWQNGVFVSLEKPAESYLTRDENEQRVEEIFLNLVAAFTAEGRALGESHSRNWAPKLFAADPRANGIRKEGFKSAMDRLFIASKIRIEESGPPSKRVRRLVLVSPVMSV